MNLLNTNTLFGEVFDDLFSPKLFPDVPDNTLNPKIQMEDNDKSIKLTVELAGVDKKDISVKTENRVLSISAKKHPNKSEHIHYNEISYGEYSRSFKLTDNIDTSKISAHMKNGVLVVELEKKEKGKPKQIKIE